MTSTTALSAAQHALNQRLLSERCMNEATIEQLYQDISAKFDNEGLSLQEAISTSNQQLGLLGLEIVAVAMGGTRHFALTNKTVHDPVCKESLHAMALTYGPREQALITAILAHLVESTTAAKNTLINLRDTMELPEDVTTRPTLTEAQDILDRLLLDKWLVVEGSCRLGPRTFCELPHFLAENLGMEAENLPQRIYL